MFKFKSSVFVTVLVLALILGLSVSSDAKTFTYSYSLPATPWTTWTGFFYNALPPVLSVQSGDIVDLSTYMLFNDQLKPGLTLDDLIRLQSISVAENKTPHTMTGPIFISSAEPGDVLEIKLLKLVPRPYGVNFSAPGMFGLGFLPEDFAGGQIKDFQIDLKKMTTQFNANIELPVRPFFGIIGVAPPAPYPISTVPPDAFGGNIDCKELVEGSTLFLPVFVRGALFAAGDAHAAQGDGEVNLSAIETAFDHAVLQFIVHKDMKLAMPFAETPTHYITFGFNPNLNEAAKTALREMIKFLTAEKGLTPLDAYSLCSVAVDLQVTQVVDGNNGIHAMLPKSIFDKKPKDKE